MSEKPEYRKASEVGSRSPASEEAQEQNASGQRGAPRGERSAATPDQPAQTSGRRGGRNQDPGEERKSFEAGEAPSEQGDGSPSAESVSERDSQKGVRPR